MRAAEQADGQIVDPVIEEIDDGRCPTYWTGFLKLWLVTIAVRLSPRARRAVPE
ncbi:MAG TPA: hypothetical protein VNN75_02335 [Stellaceae bacterium]|nr:hypothetical protein [Stellaceae bacterium]